MAALIGIWGVVCLVSALAGGGPLNVVKGYLSALSQVGWSVSTLAGQYMTAIGMVKPLHTLVDYYTHIKGIEYPICVAFFVAFPVFFKYLNKAPKSAQLSK